MSRPRAVVLAGSLLVTGCASIFDGTTQKISVNTTPAGARCTFWKNGVLISDIAATPGAVTIRKSKEDLFIVCDKAGYASATFVNHSGLAMATFANILTAGLSWAVDSSRGADNKYQGQVALALAPLPASAVPYTPMPDPEVPPPVPRRASGVPPTSLPAPAVVPSAPQLECAASDGSRIRVTGTSCPTGWTVAR